MNRDKFSKEYKYYAIYKLIETLIILDLISMEYDIVNLINILRS